MGLVVNQVEKFCVHFGPQDPCTCEISVYLTPFYDPLLLELWWIRICMMQTYNFCFHDMQNMETELLDFFLNLFKERLGYVFRHIKFYQFKSVVIFYVLSQAHAIEG